MRLILVSVLLVMVGACSVGKDSPSAEPTKAPKASPTAPESPELTQPDASGTPACAEVRAGIDAFNSQEFTNTVAHFKLAVPLAKAQALKDPSAAADDLVEAVIYYAELAPEDYPESAVSSLEFAKYKAITLGQCASAGSPADEGSPGVTT